MLALDLSLHRHGRGMRMRDAAIWTAVWITLAFAFAAIIFMRRGSDPALEFTAGYLIEKALSVDNLFVFALIFTLFGVPVAYQHRVLFWGVLGALIMRGAFIAAGAALLTHFEWVMYVFGVFLVFTAFKLATQREAAVHPERNPLIRAARRIMPVAEDYHGEHFFIRRAGRLVATPMFLVLLVVESTDLVFAVDSIPAVFAVTQDPFLVYTSNVFAILGLRSLYFLLAGALDRFYYLKPALAAILGFVGIKMLIAELYKVPIWASLTVIAGLLAIAVIASLVRGRRMGKGGGSHNDVTAAVPVSYEP